MHAESLEGLDKTIKGNQIRPLHWNTSKLLAAIPPSEKERHLRNDLRPADKSASVRAKVFVRLSWISPSPRLGGWN